MAVLAAVVNPLIASADSPRQGGTLTFVTQAKQLASADPTVAYTGQDISFLDSYVFRTLVSYTPVPGQPGFQLVPDLATDIGKASDGGKTWTWTLKSGVKWQDGSALTCADVKYGISRVFAQDILPNGPTYAIADLDIPVDAKGNSKYAGPYKKTGQDLFDKAVVCSGNTITLHLNKPVGDFNYFGSYPAMSPVKQTADTGVKYGMSPMALGPYKFADYKIGSDLTLVRNPQWNSSTDSVRHAYPDKIVIRFGVTEQARDQVFLNDSDKSAVNYDQTLLPQNQGTFFHNAKTSSRGLNVVGPYVRYSAFNVSKGHLDCLDVRKAIVSAEDVKSLVQLAGGEEFVGQTGDNILSPLLPDYTHAKFGTGDPSFNPSGNVAQAKQELAAAKSSCPATYAKVTDPKKGFSIDLADTATNRKAAAIWQNSMKRAGMYVTFNYIPSGVYYPTVQNPAKQGDLSGSGWAADWANASTVIPDLFTPGGGFDLSQNANDPAYASFAKDVATAQADTNRADQMKKWQALAQYALDQRWVSLTRFDKIQYTWGSNVGGAQFWLPQGSLIFPDLYLKS